MVYVGLALGYVGPVAVGVGCVDPVHVEYVNLGAGYVGLVRAGCVVAAVAVAVVVEGVIFVIGEEIVAFLLLGSCWTLGKG